MFDVENYLLIAIRDLIISAGIVEEYECEIEIDDQAPAVTGDRYIAISAEGLTMGANKVPELFEASFGARIAAYQRVSAIPRDRRRSIYFNLLFDLNKRLSSIATLLHFNHYLTCGINATLLEEGIEGKFVSPLKVNRADPKPRPVPHGDYAAMNSNRGDQTFSLVRGISVGGADFRGSL